MTGQPKELTYQVRTSRRARRCRVQVGPEGVVLIVPQAMPLGRAEAFLHSQYDWIRRQLDRQARHAGALPPGMLLYHGVPTTIRMVEAAISKAHAIHDAGGFTIVHPPGAPHAATVALESLLRAEAVKVLTAGVHSEARRTGLHPSSISIRNQRSRWGSCAHHGHISLNWRLLLATPEARNYVIVHELAHLAEANHGPRFWALVEQWCPGWRTERAWLRRHGALLHRPVAAALAGTP